ncbi:DUF6884 domain-containing protein [Caldalkalibacillus salinus]|uniref:DUF6884 domain-containing protein n=1 Tax=Caldalkalibacillus salinus TaxID=2803787 RepID=UPI001921BE24|nr:DUF6884 domain-containing protein [Caldalkalibacillus salinus]
MKRLCIVPCGSKKIWDIEPETGPTMAKDAYIGAFGKACQRYASQFFDHWVILSAKHGFLYPTDMIHEDYDVSFLSKSDEVIGIDRLTDQVQSKNLADFTEVHVLGGKKYRTVVEQVYNGDVQLKYPLQHCKGIGYMLQALNRANNEGKELI